MKTIKNEWPHWVILLIPFIYLAMVYPNLPDVVPTHFHGNGVPDDYSHKTIFLWITPLLTWGIYFLMLIVPQVSSKLTQPISSKAINSLRLALTVIFSFLSTVTIYLAQPKANLHSGPFLVVGAVLVLIVVIIVYFYFLYKKVQSGIASSAVEDQKNFYKWGIFYYNPKNPKLWVPKRYGFGWTLNMANPFSYLIFGALTAFLIWQIFISK